jgi:hypothetical protein
MSMERYGGMILTGANSSARGKTCPSGTFSTTNITWTVRVLCGERLATNHLSHVTATILALDAM